jgi:hypothetical protein
MLPRTRTGDVHRGRLSHQLTPALGAVHDNACHRGGTVLREGRELLAELARLNIDGEVLTARSAVLLTSALEPDWEP